MKNNAYEGNGKTLKELGIELPEGLRGPVELAYKSLRKELGRGISDILFKQILQEHVERSRGSSHS